MTSTHEHSLPSPRPLASLSLDLDNEWAYLKTRGDPAWESYPSYLDIAVPRLLETLREKGLRITVFVVGQDAAIATNGPALRGLADAGHEIGNHSMRHEPWLHRYSLQEIEDEIAEAESAIEAATGHRPRGFRGPGFSLSPDVLQVLARRGYLYDASTFPSVIGPLARAYYLLRCGFSAEQRERLSKLFGHWSDGMRPLRPYAWRVDGDSLLELPVSTMPLLRLPFHFSYVMFLAARSPRLARTYFRSALALCRLRSVEPSVLLHPLDVLGADDVPSLRFFPTMQMSAARKTEVLSACLDMLVGSFDVVPMGTHAERAAAQPSLARLELAA